MALVQASVLYSVQHIQSYWCVFFPNAKHSLGDIDRGYHFLFRKRIHNPIYVRKTFIFFPFELCTQHYEQSKYNCRYTIIVVHIWKSSMLYAEGVTVWEYNGYICMKYFVITITVVAVSFACQSKDSNAIASVLLVKSKRRYLGINTMDNSTVHMNLTTTGARGEGEEFHWEVHSITLYIYPVISVMIFIGEYFDSNIGLKIQTFAYSTKYIHPEYSHCWFADGLHNNTDIVTQPIWSVWIANVQNSCSWAVSSSVIVIVGIRYMHW